MVARLLIDEEGIRISKPGVNVTTATNPNQFSFDSRNKGLLVWHSGLYTPGSGAVTYYFPALPFRPASTFQVYSAGGWRQGYSMAFNGPVPFAIIDSTSFRINWSAQIEGESPSAYRVIIYNIRG